MPTKMKIPKWCPPLPDRWVLLSAETELLWDDDAGKAYPFVSGVACCHPFVKGGRFSLFRVSCWKQHKDYGPTKWNMEDEPVLISKAAIMLLVSKA